MPKTTEMGNGQAGGVGTENDPACVAGAACAVLDQCARFIGCLPEGCYARESRVLKGGTIGKHVRHTVDHFAAAVGGLDAGEPIDYDHRSREVPMETSPTVAMDAIARLRDRLVALDGPAMGRPVRVRVMVAGDGTEATLDSSLGRELHFAFHHAVHHHAMLKAIAGEFGVEAPSDFGVAPSTVNYQRSGV